MHALVAKTKLCDGAQMAIFASCISGELRALRFMHSKFALRPQYVSKYGRHPICDR